MLALTEPCQELLLNHVSNTYLRKTSFHSRQTPLYEGSENEDNRDGDHEGLIPLYHALGAY